MNSLLSGAQMLELDPNDIDDSDRIGFFHPDKAAAIGRLMKVDGQRTPIMVTAHPKKDGKPWKLVVGKHRTVGARLEGLKVFGNQVSGKPEDLADLEASENLHRRPLAPIERAKFTAALVQAAQERIARKNGNLKQQQLAIRARWDRVKLGEIRPDQALTDEVSDTLCQFDTAYETEGENWEKSVGEALGMSRPNIYRDLRLSRFLIEPFPDLIEQLARHPVVGENAAQLKIIATIRDESTRRDAIKALLADKELSAEGAVIAVGLGNEACRKPSGDEKHFAAVASNLNRLSAPQQKRYAPELVKYLKSAQVKRQVRDLINEQLGDVSTIDKAFRIVTSLLDGEPVDNEQLADVADALQDMLPAAQTEDGE